MLFDSMREGSLMSKNQYPYVLVESPRSQEGTELAWWLTGQARLRSHHVFSVVCSTPSQSCEAGEGTGE